MKRSKEPKLTVSASASSLDSTEDTKTLGVLHAPLGSSINEY